MFTSVVVLLMMASMASASRIKTLHSLNVTDLSNLKNENSTACNYDAHYHSPENYEGEGKVRGIETLLTEDRVLGIVYGPAFVGKGKACDNGQQNIAWIVRDIPGKESDQKKHVISYFPKPSCLNLDVNGDTCCDGGNLAGRGTCDLCPSCTGGGLWACEIAEPAGRVSKHEFSDGSKVALGSHAKGTLRLLGGSSYKLEMEGKPGCYFSHVWLESTSAWSPCALPQCVTAENEPCDCK